MQKGEHTVEGMILYHFGLLETSDIVDARVVNAWSDWVDETDTFDIIAHFNEFSFMTTFDHKQLTRLGYVK